jgi:hypothetical protein
LASHNSRYNFSHPGSWDRGGRISSIYVQAEDREGTIDGNFGTKGNRGERSVVPTTTEESEVKKEKTTRRECNKQRSLPRPQTRRQEEGIPMGLVNKRERQTFNGLENLTRFMVSLQHSMGNG